MNLKTQTRFLSVLLLLIATLSVLCVLGLITLGILHLTEPAPTETESETESESDTDVSTDPQEVFLESTADAGMAYIDQMIFFGESTTSHLLARGVLSGGTETHQVWTDSSNTRMLSSRITSEPIVYPPTKESLTVADACKREQPTYLVLSFGLNGILNFISTPSQYVNNYGKLITAIQTASPDTRIILQTVYPVSNAEHFGVDVATLNNYIETLNGYLPEIAAKYENVRVADTASVLRDTNGQLLPDYDNGDGIHLTVSAYEAILRYLRTHAWESQKGQSNS